MKPTTAICAAILANTAAFAETPLVEPERALDRVSAEQLASLDHVDEPLADAIVALRDNRGGHLNSVEDLRVLPGIDSESLDSLRRGLTVEVNLAVRATGKSYSSPEEVLEEFNFEPSIQEVQRWAQDYAKISPSLVDRWMRSSRTFALLPDLKLEYRFRDGWDNGFVYYPEDGIIDTSGESVYDVLNDAGVDQDQWFTVRAQWELDKLIMSSEQIRVINESQDVVKLREKVLVEITRLFFERRRVQVDMLLQPESELMKQVQDELRLMELTANIDALTGGAFSQSLALAANAPSAE